MKTERYEHLYTKIRESIEHPKNSTALMNCMQRGRDKRSDALAVLPGGAAFREDVKKTKDRCIEQQPELLARFVANAKKRGAQVFIAKDGAEAIEYVLRLAEKRGATIVAKSKSLTTEEIEINHPLLEAGFKVIETDLGELIIQLVGEKPYHLVFPSVHKMAEDVAEIFTKATGKTVPNDIPAIMKVVQAYLRPIFLEAEIGMTGANIGVAENGAIVIETNEGNARLVSSIGDCHVCVMGMEKIVDTVEDAMLMVLAHPVSASGQLPTTYVTWMAGRSPLGEGPSRHPRESHIIILDNGRTEMRDDDSMREALSCIRCGACMNVCPTYGVVGGHTFGYIYPGPIGIPWTAEVHGLEKAGDFASLCISCGLCKEICPAQIDMPMMIAEVKHRDAKRNGHPIVENVMMGADCAARAASAFAPLANAVMKNKAARKVIERVAGISAERKLPEFKRDTFVKRFARHKPNVSEPKHKVAFFVDLYANYNAPEMAMAVVHTLEAAGCEVLVPQQMSSGYPYIAYGNLDRAREAAAYNVARFAPYAEDGYDIVATEPTAAYALKVSYPKLLKKSAKSIAVSARTYELFEYLLHIEADQKSNEKPLAGRRFGFHVSCHQRPLGSGEGAMEWLRKRGATVALIETGTCCGMGGTFGMKTGALGYELSMAVGKPLFEKFRESGVDTIISESSVCAIQLAEGVGVPVLHPLAVLRI
ncbi:MAG: LUD domain-containing protein [Candidatus Hydrogenedentes bacterium]|nr:LUD domain-containing protein [Candidatus Hydrogenedentota bacterium]